MASRQQGCRRAGTKSEAQAKIGTPAAGMKGDISQIRLSSAAADCNRLLLELGDIVRQIQTGEIAGDLEQLAMQLKDILQMLTTTTLAPGTPVPTPRTNPAQPPPEEKNRGGAGTANYRADASTLGPLRPVPKNVFSMGAAPGVSQTAALPGGTNMLCDGEMKPEKAGLGACTGAGFNRFAGGPGPISK